MMTGMYLKIKGCVFSINSLLLKIYDELRHIAKLTNAAVPGIPESKLHNSVPTSEIQTNEYKLLCFVRNRHVSGVVCYIMNGLSYKTTFEVGVTKYIIFRNCSVYM